MALDITNASIVVSNAKLYIDQLYNIILALAKVIDAYEQKKEIENDIIFKTNDFNLELSKVISEPSVPAKLKVIPIAPNFSSDAVEFIDTSLTTELSKYIPSETLIDRLRVLDTGGIHLSNNVSIEKWVENNPDKPILNDYDEIEAAYTGVMSDAVNHSTENLTKEGFSEIKIFSKKQLGDF